jgi:PHD/YefM family antitoxin component YafN of YafNO toxin-antitoxin module
MKTIERNEATDSLAKYAEQTQDFPIVITDHGQPIAALLSVSNADLETVSLSTDPQFLSLISRSRARQEKEGGLSSEEMRRRASAALPDAE